MQVKREHYAILSICIKLPFVFKTFVLSFFKRPLKAGFTVYQNQYTLINLFKSTQFISTQCVLTAACVLIRLKSNGVARMLKKLGTSKGYYCIKQ